MRTTPINYNSPSFKATIPVRYMVLNEDGTYRRIENPEEIKTCQAKVVRMLNRDESALKDDNAKKIVEFYKQYDLDYRKNPQCASLFPKDMPWDGFIFTGEDAQYLRSLGDNIGTIQRYYKCTLKDTPIAQREEIIAKEVEKAKANYYSRGLNRARNSLSKLKNQNGDDLCLKIYFHKEYKKRSGEFKDFKLYNARFMTRNEVLKQDKIIAREKQKAKEQEIAQKQALQKAKENLHNFDNDPYADGFGYEEIDKDTND